MPPQVVKTILVRSHLKAPVEAFGNVLGTLGVLFDSCTAPARNIASQ